METHSPPQFCPKSEFRPTLTERRNSSLSQHDIGDPMADIITIGQSVLFKMGTGWENVVGKLCGLGHEEIQDHQQIEPLQSFPKGICIGHTHDRITAGYNQGLDHLRDVFGKADHLSIGALPTPNLVENRVLISPNGNPVSVDTDVGQLESRAKNPSPRVINISGNRL